MEEIVQFINNRFSQTNANWLNGNCYWFAYILCSRFPELDIYYEPIVGHFMAGDGKTYYDWTGIVRPEYVPLKFSHIKKEDSLWYDRIVRDCVM